MKAARTKNPLRNVIILGAGASAAEGAPLQQNLFRDYFKELQAESMDGVPRREMDNDLRDFFFFFFGIDVTEPVPPERQFPTFEEALGIIELALQRGESFKRFGGGPDDPWLQRVRTYLIFLICVILAKKLDRPATHHPRLLKTLQKAGELRTTSFVSINYDILIDNAITDLYRNVDLDYGVEFVNFSRPDDWAKPRKTRALFLGKLHGSLNWLYCPTCTGLTLTPKVKGVIRLLNEPHECLCLYCGSPTTPIVIPPSFFKVMSNFHLQHGWRIAERVLERADRLVFCGYSLPEADVHIKYLLKRVELHREVMPEVFIVNEHDGKDDSLRAMERQRYCRLFRDPDRVHYTTLSFQDFAEKGFDGLG